MVVAAQRRSERLAAARLYFVCDARGGRDELETLLGGALAGGAGIVQLRDKSLDDEDLLAAARIFREAADRHGALFVLNDRPDLVEATGADGVHLGQDDADPAEARRLLGEDALIGLSTHSPGQIAAACDAGIADYISVGPIWETPTKQGRAAVGLELVEIAAREATLPFFAIGGIDPQNVGEVTGAGAPRIAAVRAIRDAADPWAVARQLRAAVDRAPVL
jgi:thiamine-phosphate pyrophosphorylase